MLDVAFSPDRVGDQPLYRQLSHYLRGLIASARLPSGRKLPATRELAASLGLSRNTVSLAYDDLLADGLVTAHVGQGTFVSARRADALTGGNVPGGQPSREFVWGGLFALRARALTLPAALRPPPASQSLRFDFRGGQIDLDSLPADELRRAFSDAISRQLRDVADHKDPLGWLPLRREIARYLVVRGLSCSADDVAVVNGAQQAIDVTARVLLDPGDSVVIEQPGYFGASLAFTACQANLIGVRVDEEGIRIDELARVLRARRVKLVYVTPAAQCPTGAVMSPARRRGLLALADEHQTPIFEDDYDSELRYEGAPIAALKTQDAAGQVIYAGTFSKILFPGLRVGYVVAARPLLQKMLLARWNTDVETSVLTQAALTTMLAGGGLDRHLRRVRKIYAARLASLTAALTSAMPEGTVWTTPRGGHMVWVTLPSGIDADGLSRAALDAGIVYTRGDVFSIDGRGQDCLALSFANLAAPAIGKGIGLLGALVRRHLTQNGGTRGTTHRHR